MKKITFLLIVCTVCISASYGQKKIISPLEKKELKHEIAIDMIPLVNFNPNLNDNDYHITYKYKIKKSKLRFSVSSYSEIHSSYYSTFNIDKTTLSTIKFGIEKSTGGKLLNFVYGVDMLFGAERNYSGSQSTSNVLSDPYTRFFGGDTYHSYNGPYAESSYFIAGLSPFVGVNLNITENVGLGALISTDIYHKFGTKVYEVFPNYKLTLNIRF